MKTARVFDSKVKEVDTLDLLDWRRRIFQLYAEVRSAPKPHHGWQHWRDVRDALFRSHAQTPLAPESRDSFKRLAYFSYDPALRVLADVVPAPAELRSIAGSAGSEILFSRFALARCELGELELYWLDGYGGGVFLPFGDVTNGRETYGAGRYLLDTVKGADLGMAGNQLLLDFNFAYNPSCAYDDRWACPLTPPANRLDIEIRAGERLT
jgi:uncharacterized protein (DUF1684 family)